MSESIKSEDGKELGEGSVMSSDKESQITGSDSDIPPIKPSIEISGEDVAITFTRPKDLIGTTIGDHYEILEAIGEGAMGAVFKAQDRAMGRLVALKVLLPHLTSNGKNWGRFQQEAKAAGRINHPNCITIHSCFVDKGLLCIVMELIDGKSLSTIIKEQGALDLERTLQITEQTCEVLSAAHKLGIYHRDLKPSNLMIINEGKSEVVKVVDFGIAKIASEDGSTVGTFTETGSPIGSPQYMSPEQWSALSVDQRSDIYSLGCVFYECLAGEPPFKAQGILGLMKQHLDAEPPRFPDWIDGDKERLSKAFQIAQVALAKEPSERYQTADEFKAALDFCRASSKGNQKFFRKIKSRTKTSAKKRSSVVVAALILGSIAAASTTLLWRFKDGLGPIPAKVLRNIPLEYVVLRAPLSGEARSNSLKKTAERFVFESAAQKDDPSSLYPFIEKAKQYFEAGQYQNAAGYFQGIENICLKNEMSSSDEIIQASLDHAECLMRLSSPDFALSLATFALNAAGARAPKGAYAMLAYAKLGEISELLGNKKAASSNYEQFSLLLRNDNEEKCLQKLDLAFAEAAAGKFFLLNNDNTKAADMLSKAAPLWSKAELMHPKVMTIIKNLAAVENDYGLALSNLGNNEEASRQFDLAANDLRKVDGHKDSDVAKVLFNQSELEWASSSLWDKFSALEKRSTARSLWLHSLSPQRAGSLGNYFLPRS